jgi:prepilin-type N-terminal cleavage/methylation domain-containing protein
MKKGFTLIELLAVILILGIIALIAIPTVNNIISEARYGAFKSGNENIMKTIEQKCQTDLIKGKMPVLSYLFTDGESSNKIDAKGSFPTDGYILLNKECNITDYYLVDNKNVYSNGDDVREDYMLKKPIAAETSIFKTIYPDYYNNIISVNFINNINIPENAIGISDPSISEKGKIKSWLIPNGEFYNLYVGSEKTIYANFDSSYLFKDLTQNKSYNFSNFKINFANKIFNIFRANKQITHLDLSNWDTSNVTNMQGMFFDCNTLVDVDVSHFNTSNVTNMSHVFHKCYEIQYINVSNWDTSNVTILREFVSWDKKLKSLDVSNWDTSNGTDISAMFYDCRSLEVIDIVNWDVRKIVNMYTTFVNCISLKELDFSKWETNSLTTLSDPLYERGPFSGCSSLTKIKFGPGFNTSKVTNMRYLFNLCKSLQTIEGLQYFDTSKVTNINAIFYSCESLKSLDLSTWNLDNVTDFGSSLTNCKNLIEIKLNKYSTLYNLNGVIPSRTSLSPGTVTIVDKTGIDTTLLNSKNWNII